MKVSYLPIVYHDKFDAQTLILSGNEARLVNIKTGKESWKYVELSKNKRPISCEDQYLDFTAGVVTKDYVIVASATKNVYVFRKADGMALASTFRVKKRVAKMFVRQVSESNRLYVVDTSGEVNSIVLDNGHMAIEMGHISSITDATFTQDNHYFLTTDRDNKLRVSHFPKCYDIKAFCLGHTKGLSSVIVLSNNYAVTGSLDNTLRLWNYEEHDKAPKHASVALDEFPVALHKLDGDRFIVLYEKKAYMDIFAANLTSFTLKKLNRIESASSILSVSTDEHNVFVLHASDPQLEKYEIHHDGTFSKQLMENKNPLPSTIDVTTEERAYLSYALSKS